MVSRLWDGAPRSRAFGKIWWHATVPPRALPGLAWGLLAARLPASLGLSQDPLPREAAHLRGEPAEAHAEDGMALCPFYPLSPHQGWEDLLRAGNWGLVGPPDKPQTWAWARHLAYRVSTVGGIFGEPQGVGGSGHILVGTLCGRGCRGLEKDGMVQGWKTSHRARRGVWAAAPRGTRGHAKSSLLVPSCSCCFRWLAASTVASGQDMGLSISPRLTKC